MATTKTDTTKQHEQDEPVDIVADIVSYLKRYMHFRDDDQPIALALWVLHTHTFSPSFPRAPWVTPYVWVKSDGPSCGKSLLIDLLEPLVLNPEKAGSMSAAAMYRLIDTYSPTIFVDEVDTVFHGKAQEDLRNTLNTGYKHGGYTVRAVGNEAVKYPTFGAKLLAGIHDETHTIPDTVRTRSIPILLERKPENSECEIYYAFMALPVAEELAELCAAWVRVNGEKIIDFMPKPDGDVIYKKYPRTFEISFPLLQIAHAAGCYKEARAALVRLLTPEPEKEKPEVKMLRIIKETIGDRDKVHTEELLEALGGISGKHLSNSLKPFGISGNNTLQIGTKPDGKPNVRKGYWRYQFEEAWNKYGL